jgi:perosamine synthetase
VRHGAREVIFESYPEVGFNYRMTDLQAAVGRVQLSRLDAILGERRRLAARYNERLGSEPSIQTPMQPSWARSNWQSYCVKLAPALDQRTVMQRLLDHGVSSRRGVMCSHLEPAYHSERFRTGSGLEISERIHHTAVVLPLFSGMTDDDVTLVCDELRKATLGRDESR